jgi:predicted kinase
MIIIFGGLPGTGKTTLSRALAAQLGALHLRIDTIEQALRGSAAVGPDLLDAGYRAGYALARDNLLLGRTVVADSVNPLAVTRAAWRAAGAAASTAAVEIEVICSDTTEHRRRIESRLPDTPGLQLPTWQEVCSREYEPWDHPHLIIDTAQLSVSDALQQITATLPE